jgi:transcriptional regulator with XRE-family HTH domain
VSTDHSADLTRTGAAISAARRATGLSQRELADAAEMTRSSIANIEAGRQRIPWTRLVTIADTLGTTTSQLTGENSVAESRIPTELEARITGQQREITGLLSSMAQTLADLAAASERAEKLLADLEGKAAHADHRAHLAAENTETP